MTRGQGGGGAGAEQPTTKTEIFKLLKDNISICFQYVLLHLQHTNSHTHTHLKRTNCNCLVLFNPNIIRKEYQQEQQEQVRSKR